MMLLELRRGGILDDRIFNAITSFSRDLFLPDGLKGFANEDLDLKIFSDVTASKTSDIAKMLFLGLSNNNSTKNVLEIELVQVGKQLYSLKYITVYTLLKLIKKHIIFLAIF